MGMVVYRTKKRFLQKKVREAVLLMRLESQVGSRVGFAGHAKGFGSSLRSNVMPLKSANEGSDNCVHFFL